MSFTSEVSAFMETLGPFYEPVEEDEDNQTSIRLRNANLSVRSEQSKEDAEEDDVPREDFNLEKPLNVNDRAQNNLELSDRENDTLHMNGSLDENAKLNPPNEGCNSDII